MSFPRQCSYGNEYSVYTATKDLYRFVLENKTGEGLEDHNKVGPVEPSVHKSQPTSHCLPDLTQEPPS